MLYIVIYFTLTDINLYDYKLANRSIEKMSPNKKMREVL